MWGMEARENHLRANDWRYAKHEIVSSPEDTTRILLPKQSPTVIRVTATIYHPVRGQTDSTPDIVASGKKINIERASDHRIIAVSRDLLERWGGPLRYGDVIYLDNAGELSGYYTVEDTMNKRFTMRVDILRSPGAPLRKYENAELHMDAY
jgi:3D (Asp-Asp-Asp) domain-containing protein